jgi:hypothetical protein
MAYFAGGWEPKMNLRTVFILCGIFLAVGGLLRMGAAPRPSHLSLPLYRIRDIGKGLIPKSSEIAHLPQLVSQQPTQEDLADLHAKMEELNNYLHDSGIFAQIRLNRLPLDEQKSAAAAIEQLNDLRAREIEIRLAMIRGQINPGGNQ